MNYQIQRLDHLGIVAGMCERIKLVELIDAFFPDQKRKVTIGEAVKAMILNALGFSSRAMYLSSEFFTTKPVQLLFRPDLEPSDFNDDSLGRALDALFEANVTTIFAQVASNALDTFQIEHRFFHLDTTSFSFHGKYLSQPECEEQEEESSEEPVPIEIRRGFSKDNKPKLKQAILSMICAHKSTLPVWLETLDGNTSDKKSFPKSIQSFTEQFEASEEPCFIVDSALYTKENIGTLTDSNWLTRVPETLSTAKALLNFVKDENFEETDQEGYKIYDTSREYGGLIHRWLVIHSEKGREREWESAMKRIEKAKEQEQKEFEKLMREEFNCEDDAQATLGKVSKKWKYQQVDDASFKKVEHFKGRGRPKKGENPERIGWKVEGELVDNEEALKKAQASVGRFILATNLPKEELSAEDALRNYKIQGSSVERGFRFLKDPMFFADGVYLQKPSRIMALLMIMTMSLLVYSLAEKELREQLARNNDTVPDQKGKETNRITMRRVFQMFEGVNVLRLNAGGESEQTLIELSDLQQKIISHLGASVGKCYGQD